MFRFAPGPNRAHLIEWRGWGPNAFQEAQRQDRPIALLVAAFWCAVCHRMDETTFSDDNVIQFLNTAFLPVRVDEAQRPDISVRYNQNGWPTVAFLTPSGHHLMSVNYLPPDQFHEVLVQLRRVYDERRAEIEEVAARVQHRFAASAANKPRATDPGAPIVAEVSGILVGLADTKYGGFGSREKFPHVDAIEFLLYRYETTGDPWFLDQAMLTLDGLRTGEVHDSVGGGFFRYASGPDWTRPHREKLLADQAGLLSCYLHAYLLTGRAECRQVAEELTHFLDTTLSDPSGTAFLGCEDYARAEGQGSEAAGRPRETFSMIDACVYTDANALAASAYLDAWWVLGDPDHRERALRLLEFLWLECRDPAGGMCHYYDPHAGMACVTGLLGDDVNMGTALLDACRVTGESHHVQRAEELAEHLLRRHRNPAGGFYDIEEAGLANLQFRLTLVEQNGAAAAFLLRLGDLTHEAGYREAAQQALQAFAGDFRRYGIGAARYGHSVGRSLAGAPLRVVVEGRPGDPQVREMAGAALVSSGHPNAVLAFRESDGQPARVRFEEG
ncbi:MAG: thioredoxin domain-containing protein [Chloroflexi bacterium]|nr:thioredoxin domain-containing protein [Chloroflexota bacterium]